MFSFLRTDRLNTKLVELSRKPFQISAIMKQVYNNFSSESKVWFPFLHLRELLSDDTKSKEVLTVDHHRLLFEDFVELCEGDYVIILINSSHHFLSLLETSIKMYSTTKSFKNESHWKETLFLFSRLLFVRIGMERTLSIIYLTKMK